MATINHKTYNEGTETFKDFSVYDGKDTLIFKVDGSSAAVGIGTSSPVLRLDVKGAAADTTTVGGATVEQSTLFRPSNDAGGMRFGFDASSNAYLWSATSGASLRLGTRSAPDNNVNMTILSSGNVGIGTSSPAVKLDVVGVVGADGIKFPATQVPSADVNTLDDYEEGTFTYSITFGGGSTGITYNHRTGTYTKIGNKVTINGLISLSNKGSDTGDARITGLPFTIPNAVANYTAPSFQLFNITFANQVFGYAVINTTQISINEMTEAGVVTTLTNADFANNSEVIIGLTYFV